MLVEQPRRSLDGLDPGGQYRGRLAPSPTGLLHVGHARTFWTACQRAQQAKQAGREAVVVMRIDDLDGDRCKPEYVTASYEDLRWLGMDWQEGPDVGGPHQPYVQSERIPQYRAALELLQARGLVYKCKCSRKDIAAALSAPHAGEEEPVYPGMCRSPLPPWPPVGLTVGPSSHPLPGTDAADHPGESLRVWWDAEAAQHTAHASAQQSRAQEPHPSGVCECSEAEHNGVGSTVLHAQQAPAHSPVATGSMAVPTPPPAVHTPCEQSANGGTRQTSGKDGDTDSREGADAPPHSAPPSDQPPLTSSAARQQLKAARRAEREAKQALARAARSARHKGDVQGCTAGAGGAGDGMQRGASTTPVGGPHPESAFSPQGGQPPSDTRVPQQRSQDSGRGAGGPKWSWRFRVPPGVAVRFHDNCLGPQEFVAGVDFGDFLVWRHDDVPSYQLACVVDDAQMGVTEVVRGADLLLSTARQLLLARALGLRTPAYYHAPLVVNPVTSQRLAKRSDAVSLRALRDRGATPAQVLDSTTVWAL